MSKLEEIRGLLGHVLSLGERANRLELSSRLLGDLPEFDSMAVVSLIAALEEHYDFAVADDEINADTFETVGTLCTFVENKLR